MNNNSVTCVAIGSEGDIVEARQKGRELSKQIGFGLTDQARIATGISELARNILLYAGSGQVIINIVEIEGRRGIEIMAQDQGPGIMSLEQALMDGFSTSRGLGVGLPGTKRLMDELYIESTFNQGTVVIARKWIN